MSITVHIITCPSGYVYNIDGRGYFYLTKAIEDGALTIRQAEELVKKTKPLPEQTLEISDA